MPRSTPASDSAASAATVADVEPQTGATDAETTPAVTDGTPPAALEADDPSAATEAERGDQTEQRNHPAADDGTDKVLTLIGLDDAFYVQVSVDNEEPVTYEITRYGTHVPGRHVADVRKAAAALGKQLHSEHPADESAPAQ